MNPPAQPWLRRLERACYLLGALSLAALIANLSVLAILFPIVVSFEPLPAWTDGAMNGIAGTGFLVVAVFHLLALATLGWQTKALQQAAFVPALAFALGVVSLLLVAANFPLLGDIGKEYHAGLDTTGEWRFVFFNHGVHVLFVTLALVRIGYARRALHLARVTEPAARDDVIFLSTHVVGIFSGLAGLGMLVALVAFEFPARFLSQAAAVLSVLVGAPYVVAAASWLFLKRGEPVREWLDEKQTTDVGRAALLTLLVLLLILGVLFVAQDLAGPPAIVRDMWFPITAFLALFLFSASAAWLGRRV